MKLFALRFAPIKCGGLKLYPLSSLNPLNWLKLMFGAVRKYPDDRLIKLTTDRNGSLFKLAKNYDLFITNLEGNYYSDIFILTEKNRFVCVSRYANKFDEAAKISNDYMRVWLSEDDTLDNFIDDIARFSKIYARKNHFRIRINYRFGDERLLSIETEHYYSRVGDILLRRYLPNDPYLDPYYEKVN